MWRATRAADVRIPAAIEAQRSEPADTDDLGARQPGGDDVQMGSISSANRVANGDRRGCLREAVAAGRIHDVSADHGHEG